MEPIHHGAPGDPWSQPTPAMQFVTLNQSGWGHFENFKEGLITKEKLIEHLTAHFEQCFALIPHLKAGAWPGFPFVD